MPLSEHEQRLLEQIEQSLYAEDPKFARSWRSKDLRSVQRTRVLRAAAAFVVGLAVLLAGVITLNGSTPAGIGLGVGGFVVMLTAAVVALSVRGGARSATARQPRAGRRLRRRGGSAAGRAPLVQRLEERWQRRQDGR